MPRFAKSQCHCRIFGLTEVEIKNMWNFLLKNLWVTWVPILSKFSSKSSTTTLLIWGIQWKKRIYIGCLGLSLKRSMFVLFVTRAAALQVFWVSLVLGLRLGKEILLGTLQTNFGLYSPTFVKTLLHVCVNVFFSQDTGCGSYVIARNLTRNWKETPGTLQIWNWEMMVSHLARLLPMDPVDVTTHIYIWELSKRSMKGVSFA